MPDAEGHTGNYDGRFDIVLCDGGKQEPAEDHFLQKPDAKHTHDAADRFRRRVIECSPVPKVSRCQDKQRHIVKEPPRGNGGFAESVPLLQAVFPDEGKKNNGLQDAENGACGVCNAYDVIQRICKGLQKAINHNPYDGEGQFVFLI